MEDRCFILEFIKVYRSLTALWNVKEKEYSNRILKSEQYETLLKKYQEKFPQATKKEVSQKINTLRTNYRRELKRILALERSGCGLTEENESTLFYFDAMDFLRDNEKPLSQKKELFIKNETEIPMQSSLSAEPEFQEHDVSNGFHKSPSVPKQHFVTRRRRPYNSQGLIESSKQMKEAISSLNALNNKNSREDDEYDLFGKLIAKKLRKLHESNSEAMMFEIHKLFVERPHQSQIVYESADRDIDIDSKDFIISSE